MEGEEGSGGHSGVWATRGDGSYMDKGGLWGKAATTACVCACVCMHVCVCVRACGCVFFFSSYAWMFQALISSKALHIAVRRLGFMVKRSLLSLGSSSVLPGTDQVQEQIESITSQAASGLVNTF